MSEQTALDVSNRLATAGGIGQDPESVRRHARERIGCRALFRAPAFAVSPPVDSGNRLEYRDRAGLQRIVCGEAVPRPREPLIDRAALDCREPRLPAP